MKKEWKKKASFEYRIPNIFCTFKLFIGNKYKILLPTPVFIICTSNNGNIYTPRTVTAVSKPDITLRAFFFTFILLNPSFLILLCMVIC